MGGEPAKGTTLERDISFAEWQGLQQVYRANAGKPFCAKAVAYMDFWGWDSADFQVETGLLPKNHSLIINGKVKRMSADNAVALCKGLRLTLPLAMDLLHSAHIAISDGEDDEYLRYILEVKMGASVDECNAFLKKIGKPKLGSKTAA